MSDLERIKTEAGNASPTYIKALEAEVERLTAQVAATEKAGLAAEDEAGRHRATIKRLRVELGSIARIWENGGDRGWERSAQAYDMRCVARAALEDGQ